MCMSLSGDVKVVPKTHPLHNVHNKFDYTVCAPLAVLHDLAVPCELDPLLAHALCPNRTIRNVTLCIVQATVVKLLSLLELDPLLDVLRSWASSVHCLTVSPHFKLWH